VLYEAPIEVNEAYSLIEDCPARRSRLFGGGIFSRWSLRRMKDEAAPKRFLRKLSVNEQADPLVRAQAWAGIAQMLDAGGKDFEGAMRSDAQLQRKFSCFRGLIV